MNKNNIYLNGIKLTPNQVKVLKLGLSSVLAYLIQEEPSEIEDINAIKTVINIALHKNELPA